MNFNRNDIFCTVCGSFNLELVEDEMISELGDSKITTVIKCSSCQCYFTQEFVANNLTGFTSMDELKKVRERHDFKASYYKDYKAEEKERPLGRTVADKRRRRTV